MKKNILLLSLLCTTVFSETFFYNNGKKVFLTPHENLIRENSSTKYFKTRNNKKIGITDQIVVKLKKDTNINELLKKYDLKLIKKYSKTLFLVSTKNVLDALETANSLHEDNATKYAQPNFTIEVIKR